MSIGLSILFFCALVFISALFSFAETVLVGRTSEMINVLSRKEKEQELLHKLMHGRDKLLSVILLGNSLCNSIASAIGTIAVVSELHKRQIDSSYIIALVTLLIATLIFLFGELMPKSLGLIKRSGFDLRIMRMVFVLEQILYPMVFVTGWIVMKAMKPFGINFSSTGYNSTSQEISAIVEARHVEGKIFRYYRDMLKGLLALDRTEVGSIMTHKTDVLCINIEAMSSKEIIETILSGTYSRIPIYEGSMDNVIGVLHEKDISLLYYKKHKEKNSEISMETVRSLMKKPMFVTENATLYKQLSRFKTTRTHMAVVVDEFGTFIGIITLKDIIEEIVGEIDDEHNSDKSGKSYTVVEGGLIIVDGDYLIHDFNRAFDANLKDGDAKTLAGLIIEKLERIPEVGKKLELFGYEVCVKSTKENKITKLEMKKIP